MNKTKILVLVFILISVSVGFFLYKNRNQTKVLTNQVVFNQSNNYQTLNEPTLTPTPGITEVKENTIQNSSSYDGIPTITCSYDSPAAPDHQGTGTIKSSWNNLIPGKSGSAKVAVCMSANGGSPTLLFTSKDGSEKNINSVNWLSLNVLYVFSLYDQKGGDLPDCAGTYLASCQIKTQSLVTNTPTPVGGRGRP